MALFHSFKMFLNCAACNDAVSSGRDGFVLTKAHCRRDNSEQRKSVELLGGREWEFDMSLPTRRRRMADSRSMGSTEC